MTWSHSQLVVYLFIILQKIKSAAAHHGEHLNSPLLHSPPSTGQASSGSSPQSGRHCQRQDTADIRSVLVNNSLLKTNTYDVN